jgi:hypothetical protein
MVDNPVVVNKVDTTELNFSESVRILKESQNAGYKSEYLEGRVFVYAITLNDLMLNSKSALVI